MSFYQIEIWKHLELFEVLFLIRGSHWNHWGPLTTVDARAAPPEILMQLCACSLCTGEFYTLFSLRCVARVENHHLIHLFVKQSHRDACQNADSQVPAQENQIHQFWDNSESESESESLSKSQPQCDSNTGDPWATLRNTFLQSISRKRMCGRTEMYFTIGSLGIRK